MSKLVVCNQKMYLTRKEAKELSEQLTNYNWDNLIICPNMLNIDLYDEYNICAQNCHFENNGAYTGEVSAFHLKQIGVKYVLLGHSERRCYDDDKIINKKVKAVIKNDLIPILCIGETYYERELNKTGEVLKRQLLAGLKSINKESNIIIAYEPSWVIGTKKSLGKKDIEDTSLYIKKILNSMGLEKYKILYGGSVTDNNIKNILTDKIDGYLIGASSVNFDSIKKIIKCIKM